VKRLSVFLSALIFSLPAFSGPGCPAHAPLALQVLGSGGPELAGQRAATSYLLWIDGRARALIDLGPGSALRFFETNAAFEDLDAIFLTHLHADHAADLPAFIKASFFGAREAKLPVFGPVGNKFMPNTVHFVRSHFDSTAGVYRYLGAYVSPLDQHTYKLEPHDVRAKPRKLALPNAPKKTEDDLISVFANERFKVTAAAVPHGQLPALAFRVELKGKAVVVSGDTTGDAPALKLLLKGANLFIAHHAIAEEAGPVERTLHMPPSTIGQLAKDAGVKQLALTHRMRRTLGKEEASTGAIRKHYEGPLAFANDLDCFVP
jgi:ribonuclease BN (tRNA processing enzyme)